MSILNARRLRHAKVLPTKAAIAELAAAGWLRSHPGRAGDNPGRQRKDWEINPKLKEVVG